jgi:hypothetical protein
MDLVLTYLKQKEEIKGSRFSGYVEGETVQINKCIYIVVGK